MSATVDFETVVSGIRARARFARWSAICAILGLTGFGIGTAYYFLQTGSAPLITIGERTLLTNSTLNATLGGVEWLSELTKSFVRIASVIMVVFFINILVSFSRYNMRVANYLDSRADCLLITNSEPELFAKMLPILSVDPLDFISTPTNPYDTYLETIKSMFPRITFPAADKAVDKINEPPK